MRGPDGIRRSGPYQEQARTGARIRVADTFDPRRPHTSSGLRVAVHIVGWPRPELDDEAISLAVCHRRDIVKIF